MCVCLVDLKHLFRIKRNPKSLKFIARKISTASVIGSFLIFHKIDIRRRNHNDEPTAPDHRSEIPPGITDNTIGDVSREEPDLPENLLL